ncbi:MAG: prepilin-type N-terminal cleavage/methylation domain-containing protein [Candidatus Riflebacteria bacterium]|nr:prepilin-type N-terminal cleavage/methylation domain-containing protein [Candidatus Riflebacteria bacterium]
MKLRQRLGFTAIELVIVVTIIGILAATGIGKYQRYSSIARKSTCLGNQDQIAAAVRATESDLAPLDANTAIRFWYNGVIDDGHLTPTADTSRTNYRVWVGFVPPIWQQTFNGAANASNASVLSRAQGPGIFKCPEDARYMDPYDTTSNPSDATGQTRASPAAPQTYTYAKLVVAPRSTTGGIGSLTNDPLEGYNWMSQGIEWNNSAFAFCRRWGLRDTNVMGITSPSLVVLNTRDGDSKFLPGGERVLSHTSAISVNP